MDGEPAARPGNRPLRVPGRRTPDEVVVHTSVGVGVQDAAAADHIARALGA